MILKVKYFQLNYWSQACKFFWFWHDSLLHYCDALAYRKLHDASPNTSDL